MLTVECGGKNITTIEGLAQDGTLDPLQQSFVDNLAMQCGFCTAGQILSAKALLLTNNTPTLEDVKTALSGNTCRCGSYMHIYTAVLAAANATGGA
jgi:carbon-monoxide dehydrogenase small subunit